MDAQSDALPLLLMAAKYVEPHLFEYETYQGISGRILPAVMDEDEQDATYQDCISSNEDESYEEDDRIYTTSRPSKKRVCLKLTSLNVIFIEIRSWKEEDESKSRKNRVEH